MEEDLDKILSPLLEKSHIQKQLDRLSEAADEAQKRVDYEVAHDKEILRAIEVVERFLRKKRRVCYGGQAINSLLPKSHRFYDEKYNIPDYDFFTPDRDGDVEEIIRMLEQEGFVDVGKKVGIHDGTMKVMVNFIAVADCTYMPPPFFKVVQHRAKAVEGILYSDPDFLRMMMYLELSRPRGQVERWKKVYERLMLLNNSFPIRKCYDDIKVDDAVSWKERQVAMEFIISRKRVLLGPEGIEILSKQPSSVSKKSLIQRGGPVIMLSAEAQKDAEDIVDMMSEGSEKVKKVYKIENVKAELDNTYSFVTVKARGQPIVLILEGTACHSYVPFSGEGVGEIRIGSPDLLLNIYYTCLIFGKKELPFFQTSLQCLIEKIHSVLDDARNHPSDRLPAFAVRCSGREKGMATLLKERQERTEAEKKKKKAQSGGKRSRRIGKKGRSSQTKKN